MASPNKLKISLEEITLATNGFAEASIIGRGGFGVVYRGESEQHGKLAIKRLNHGLGQGDHEYGMEVTLLSKFKHENLVSLVGFCGEGGEKILVYKYEANQSLDKFLRGKDLSWMRRLHICVGAARGLRYLHNETGSGNGVVYRDIKSSNILLDENWNAKISDFGLSKITLTNSADSVMFSAACGTLGYVDPQILYGCGITLKSDVYSFGVVLFEVLFGKFVAIPAHLVDGCFTINLAEKHYKEKTLAKMIHPDLRNEMDSNSLSTFSAIAYQCLKTRTEDRPTMSLVVKALEKELSYQQVASTRSQSFGQSSSKEYLYDVYISFGDERSHADSLCFYLQKEGLSDYQGDIISSGKSRLVSAIKQSRAYIIVFSKNFPRSSWNLEEVAKIVKCMKERASVVIPIFLENLNPSELREQKGYFWEVMSTYDEYPKFTAWRSAIVEAINMPSNEELELSYYGDIAKMLRQELRKS